MNPKTDNRRCVMVARSKEQWMAISKKFGTHVCHPNWWYIERNVNSLMGFCYDERPDGGAACGAYANNPYENQLSNDKDYREVFLLGIQPNGERLVKQEVF